MIHDANTLRTILNKLALVDRVSSDEARVLAYEFRDCRLELLRCDAIALTDEQRHRLQQMDYRLQMVVEGQGAAEGIASEARCAMRLCGWTANL
jgi:hypothetical protein